METRIFLTLTVLAAAFSGCLNERSEKPAETRLALGSSGLEPMDTLIPWGSGHGEVGLLPGGAEAPARGPLSMAIAPSGDVLVLDALNRRVLGIRPDGETYVAAPAPFGAIDLAAGPDGSLALWNTITAKVHVIAANGSSSILDVPRPIRMIQGIDLLNSKLVILRTAYQERYILGSPSAPVTWPRILFTKMKGVYPWGADRGLQVVVKAGGPPTLLVVKNRAGGQEPDEASRKAAVLWTLDTPAANAARIAGTNKAGIVCLRIEEITSQNPVRVTRTLWCGMPETKQVLLETVLGDTVLFAPAKDTALSKTLPMAAAMWAEPEGLRVKTYLLGGEEAAP